MEQILIDVDFVYFIIEITNKYNEKEILYDFNFRLEDFKKNKDKIQLLGTPIIDYDSGNYDQYVVETFMRWKKGEIISFLNLNVEYKKSYNYSCLVWSGVPREFKNNYYDIDLGLVKSNADFYNILGYSFFGDRGYIGHDSYSFEDSLNNINRYSQERVTIILKAYFEIKFQDKLYVDKIIRKKYKNIIFQIAS